LSHVPPRKALAAPRVNENHWPPCGRPWPCASLCKNTNVTQEKVYKRLSEWKYWNLIEGTENIKDNRNPNNEISSAMNTQFLLIEWPSGDYAQSVRLLFPQQSKQNGLIQRPNSIFLDLEVCETRLKEKRNYSLQSTIDSMGLQESQVYWSITENRA